MYLQISAIKKTVYIFNCSKERNLFGFTEDIIGKNLPDASCDGKWLRFRIIAISAKSPSLNGVERQEIAKAIDEQGYYIAFLPLDFLGKRTLP